MVQYARTLRRARYIFDHKFDHKFAVWVKQARHYRAQYCSVGWQEHVSCLNSTMMPQKHNRYWWYNQFFCLEKLILCFMNLGDSDSDWTIGKLIHRVNMQYTPLKTHIWYAVQRICAYLSSLLFSWYACFVCVISTYTATLFCVLFFVLFLWFYLMWASLFY